MIVRKLTLAEEVREKASEVLCRALEHQIDYDDVALFAHDVIKLVTEANAILGVKKYFDSQTSAGLIEPKFDRRKE